MCPLFLRLRVGFPPVLRILTWQGLGLAGEIRWDRSSLATVLPARPTGYDPFTRLVRIRLMRLDEEDVYYERVDADQMPLVTSPFFQR